LRGAISSPRHRGRFPRTDTDRRLGKLYLEPRAQVREYCYATNNSHQQLIQCIRESYARAYSITLLPESMPSPTFSILALCQGGFKFQVQRVNNGAVAHRLPEACHLSSLLARRARLAGKARLEVRSSGFEVPKTSNFGPRTLVRLTRHATLAPLAPLPHLTRPAFLASLASLARITFHASRFTVPIQHAPLPLMTAAGVARRILMSAQSDRSLA